MRKNFFLFLICFVHSVFAQQVFKTSTKAHEVAERFFQNKSIEWIIPISPSERLTLQWSERKNSFTEKTGIRTFVGYQGDLFIATMSISNTGDVSGDFTWKEKQWRIVTSRDGYLSIIKESSQGKCGGCDGGNCNVHGNMGVHRNPANIFSKAGSQSKQIHTDNFLRVFRLAVLVDKHYYNRYGSKQSVRGFWSRLETSLNEYYAREIGITFQIVNNDKLIIDSSPIFDGKTADRIINSATFKISNLIGEENYDAGIVIARNSDTGIGGLAGLGRVNYSTSKAKAMSTNINRIIAHELGHLFGSLHTFTTGGTSTIKTEPGNGQSIMSYGTPVNFFSLPSIYFIRETVRANTMVGTSKNNEAPVIDTTKLSREYTLPKETFFQFKIDATDSDGDPLLYAFHQADIRKNNAQFESEKSTRDNTKAFYNHWVIGSFVKREYDLSAGKAYTFWLGVNDTKDTYNEIINHPTRYDMYETKVKYVDGIPFKITNFQSKKYKTGEKVMLTWNVDSLLRNHKVRILLSNDFGKTFNHVLALETENDGSHEIVMPHTAIGRQVYHADQNGNPIFHSGLGLIKIEVIDHIAFALTNNDVTGNGGFEVENSEIIFTKTPPSNIKILDGSPIPHADIEAVSTCSGNSTTQLTLNEVRYQNFITRTWTAQDSCGNTSSFVQHIEIEQPTPPPTPSTPQQVKGRVGVNTENPEVTLDIRRIELHLLPLGQPQGVSFPNFTTTERDTFDKKEIKEGTMIYNNTKKCLEIFQHNTWMCLGKPANSNTSTSTILTKKYTKGRMGINTGNPQASLDIMEIDIHVLPMGQPQGVSFPNFTTQKRNSFDKQKIKEGTMIYNITEKCLQIFQDNDWNCFHAFPAINGSSIPLAAAPSKEYYKGRVGINISKPQATLDIREIDENFLQGVSFPNFTTLERASFDTTEIKEGTMIYNTTEKCLEIFQNNLWECLR